MKERICRKNKGGKTMKVIKRIFIMDRPNEYIRDVINDYYVGCVYPDNSSSYYVCSNIPSEYTAFEIMCRDGSFYAFFSDEELANGAPGTVIKYYLKRR